MINRSLIQAAFWQALIERAQRRVHEILELAEAGDVRPEMLAEAERLQAQVEALVENMRALAHDEEAACNN